MVLSRPAGKNRQGMENTRYPNRFQRAKSDHITYLKIYNYGSNINEKLDSALVAFMNEVKVHEELGRLKDNSYVLQAEIWALHKISTGSTRSENRA